MTLVGSLDAKAPVQAKYDIAAVYGNARAPPKVTLKVMPSTVPWESCWTTLHMSTLLTIYVNKTPTCLFCAAAAAAVYVALAAGDQPCASGISAGSTHPRHIRWKKLPG
eukprot:scaffold57554_cov16-Tisochrysis_lutea.AAC.1